MYHDCFECGGKCCKFFGVPGNYENVLHTDGVPLSIYRSDLEPNPRRYFELHEGVTINDSGDRFIVSKYVRTELKNTRRFGRYIIVYSKCTKLGENGECTIYPDRPDMCKNFVARTAGRYLVLAGCIFDPGNLGEHFDL